MTSHAHPMEQAGAVTTARTGEAWQPARALVLGGGGPVGRAWMGGLVAGLISSGVDLGRADLIVGTSAGAVVGAHLALGLDVAALAVASARQPGPNIYASAVGLDTLFADIAAAARAANPDGVRAAIGRTAVAAETIGEDAFLARSVYAGLAGRPWPPSFRATAVSATTGRLAVWSEDSHVDLARAVASSTAIPGASPPVTLDGDRYMDGGVRSMINADLAAGARVVIAVSCFPLAAPDGVGPDLVRRELATITEAGGGAGDARAGARIPAPEWPWQPPPGRQPGTRGDRGGVPPGEGRSHATRPVDAALTRAPMSARAGGDRHAGSPAEATGLAADDGCAAPIGGANAPRRLGVGAAHGGDDDRCHPPHAGCRRGATGARPGRGGASARHTRAKRR